MATTVWLDESECTRDGGLPPVCMKCGAEAHQTVRKNFSWTPGWVILLIFVQVLIWLIVSMILTKRMVVYVPLCLEHKGIFTKRAAITAVLVVMAIASLVIGFAVPLSMQQPGGREPDWIGFSIFGGAIMMLVLLIAAAIVSQSGISPAEITERDIRLKGVHEEFKEALVDQRRADRAERDRRRAERSDVEEDDDDYDDRPRRRRSRYED